jgi:mRNA interferase MazF
MYTKNFKAWNALKTQLNEEAKRPNFKEREIWWCCIGVNVGDEMDGKNERFNRPVLVIRKFNKNLFWGIPLSTKIKDNPFYLLINFKGMPQSALLTQIRIFESKRLTHKIGQLSENEFFDVKDALKKML